MKLIEIEAFKSKGLGNADGIRQFFYPEIKVYGEAPNTLDFTISTGAVDRDNDTIDPGGWKLDAYKKNPVVLWAHDYTSLPVAKAMETWIESGQGQGNLSLPGLKSRAEFTPRDLYEFGHTVFQLYANGFLKATSVGFKPSAFEEASDRKMGINFREQELLEYSCVPVPSNPEALIEARSAGIDISPLKAWAEETLDNWHNEKGMWLPRAKVEAILQITDTSKTYDMGINNVTINSGDNGTSTYTVPDITKGEEVETEIKVGRVISAANENKLKQSRDLIDQVISQISAEESAPDPTIKSIEVSPKDDIDETTLRSIISETVKAEIRKATGKLD